ncbi:MAG: PIG-L deacetylase family protein [Nocardioides sp.]
MPQHWQQHPSWGRGPVLDLRSGGQAWERLVVVSAHPDDESLGVGGLIAHAHRAGIGVYLVLLTAGESSHPPAEHCSRHSLATRRLAEMDAAVDLLAPGSPVVFLGAPDGGVADVEEEVVAALGEIVGEGHGTLLVAPWRRDGHPDHDAAGRAAARVAASSGARLVEYPLLMWHRLQPDEAPWEQMAVLRLDEASLETKLAAIRAHASQIRSAGGAPAPLDGHFLGHFTVPLEHLVLSTEPAPPPARGQDPVEAGQPA